MQKSIWYLAIVLVCCGISRLASATEVTPFKMTSLDGELAIRYLYDNQSVTDSGVDTQQEIRPTYQEELRLETTSYIYHPYLLNMEINGGFLLDQSSYETLDDSSSTQEELFNFNARLNFLEKKPYPITVYYDKQNPSVSTGVAGRYIQENIRYGVDASIMQPISPVLISVKAFRQTMQGEGTDQIIDDDEEQVVLRLYSAYDSGAHMELTHQENQLISNSGSPGIAITTTETARSSTNFDSRNLFGRNNELQLTMNLTHNTRDTYPVREESTFSPGLSWKHTDYVASYYRMSFLESSEEMFDTSLQQLNTGFGYHDKLLSSGMSLHAESNETTNASTDLLGLKYNVSYKKFFKKTSLQMNVNGLYENRDQVDSVGSVNVFGESVILNSIDIITLSQNYIDNTSIEVWNESRTQQFQEGVDYRVIRIAQDAGGANIDFQIQIQRYVAGNILDGQTVLVDYTYQTGGSFAYNMTGNNFNINWSILNSYDVYLRYQESDVNLQKGAPSIQLNSITSFTYGVRVDKSLLNGINLGGDISQEDRREDINPYTRKNIEAFVDMPLPNLTNLRLTGRRVQQDNENSDEDTDIKGGTLRIQSRPWLRGTLALESTYEKDSGGTIPRMMRTHRMHINWALRQLAVGGSLNYGKEEQGSIERHRWEIGISASRKF